jgi:hypothetical protein|tara:strand:- start:77 stop:640 length:564 start_codon:yes stop_codon:yes gene_type:complete
MKIQVVRTQFGIDATNGMMFIDGKFECYTLEDQYQAVKVMHETCIPEGTYQIKFRKVGGFHTKYSARYKNAHYGMLELQDVPDFKYILIHSGNTDEHTSGCILTGNTQQDLDLGKDGMIGQSRNAYERMYRKVSAVLLQGKPVELEVSKINLDGATETEQSSDKQMLHAIHEKVTRIDSKLRGKPII